MENNISFKSLLPMVLIGSIVAALIGHYLSVYLFMHKFLGINEYKFNFKDVFLLYELKKQYITTPIIYKKIILFIAASYSLIILWLAIVFLAFFGNGRKLHGDARFANLVEIKKAGLLPDMEGKNKPKYPPILIGKLNNGQFLKYCSNEFFSLAAPTRTGKGVSSVIPNLLNYPESVVVFDVKFENFDITSGFRSKYSEVYRFSPTAHDYSSHCYNPLDCIRKNERLHVVSDIQNIAKILYSTSNPSADPFFNEGAQTLFLGLCLYSIEKDLPLNLASLLQFSTPKTGQSLQEWIKDTIPSEINNLSLDCVDALLSFANTSDKTASSILSSFQTPLNIFRDPVIAEATSRSDFSFSDVRKKKMSIYICIYVGDVDKCKHLLNLIFSQLIDLNTKVLPSQDKSLKYQCLLLLDEFTSLGYMSVIEKGISFIAGYGLRLLLIFQNRGQLKISYEKSASTILENVNGKAIFAPGDNEDARDYSELLGYQTVKGKSHSNQSKGGSSTTTNDQKRALMLPQELREIPFEKQVIVFRGQKPIYCNKIIYHEDEVFRTRQNLPTPTVPMLKVAEDDLNEREREKKNALIKQKEIDVENLKDISFDKRLNNREILNIIYETGGVVEPDLEVI